MIRTLLRVDWLNLQRDYVALGLTYVVPLIFFSIFALIFGTMGGGGDGAQRSLAVLVVDEDQSDVSRRFVERLSRQKSLVTSALAAPTAAGGEVSDARGETRSQVRQGKFPAAVLIPEGWGAAFGDFAREGPAVELIYDAANPFARYTVTGLLQASAFTAAPDVLMEKGFEWFDRMGSALTPQQRTMLESLKPLVRGEGGDRQGIAPDASDEEAALGSLVRVEATAARSEPSDRSMHRGPSLVAHYAAGIGVMFLLFSMAGAGSSLLEEEETGTLERILGSRMRMGPLLVSKWLFWSFLGVLQMAIMFVWGALAFGLELWTSNHLAGFAVMTLVTSAAAAAFAMMLAAVSRSRAQLNLISTTLIMVMSALGGSMVPRVFMPEFMRTPALFTFNGWAMDGYLKVFWHDDPSATLVGSLVAVVPQVAMLAAMTVTFLAVARMLARRWEAV